MRLSCVQEDLSSKPTGRRRINSTSTANVSEPPMPMKPANAGEQPMPMCDPGGKPSTVGNAILGFANARAGGPSEPSIPVDRNGNPINPIPMLADEEGHAEYHGDEFPDDQCVVIKPVRSPIQPTQQEIDQHEVSHLPYRSWCVSCVRGKGRNLAHKKLQNSCEQVSHKSPL